MFILNMSWVLRSVWGMVKGFLDEKTTKKISVLGADYTKTLLEHIDKENLPEFLGGSCTCAATTGDCMTSKLGPW
jgi:hypothetical protein